MSQTAVRCARDAMFLWRGALRLTEWTVMLSPIAPDEDHQRSSVDIDTNLQRAVIRLDPTCPHDQIERQVLHELLHLRLAGLWDVFTEVTDASLPKTWWRRYEERSIEALVDALLPDQPRREWRGGPAWTSGE